MLALLVGALAHGQEEVNGQWTDNDLAFKVEWENIKQSGEVDLCIAKASEDVCIRNLFTSFEVLIYDAKGEVINKSIWTGLNLNIKFKQPIPQAHRMVIKAVKPFVINRLTKTKIHQQKPLELEVMLR